MRGIIPGMLRALTIAALALTGCTAGMHHTYQNTLGVVALAGWGTGGAITYRELTKTDSAFAESRPSFGMGPRTMVAAFMLTDVAVIAATRFMPDDLFDQYTPWVKDVLMTTWALSGAVDGYCDYTLTH